ncbi:MAG: glycosyltransferase family 2 protein [Bacteroidales bacterium]|nr:glycosyltransferase family 2 protein [Bacteroidales bacterium]
MERLSVIVIYHFDDDQIEKCIRSTQDIADEIILLDPSNHPKSKELTRNFGITHLPGHNTGLLELIQKAVKLATSDRLFFVGSNEYLSESLRKSIREVKTKWDKDGYSISRYKNYYGKWMRHSGIYPDQPVRLYKKDAANWSGESLEEHIELNNPESVDLLNGDLYCTVFKNIQEHIVYLNQATQIEATKSYKKGNKVNSLQIIFLPFKYFFNQYFIKLGFLDGFYGLIFAVLIGFSKFLELVKLRDFMRSNRK